MPDSPDFAVCHFSDYCCSGRERFQFLFLSVSKELASCFQSQVGFTIATTNIPIERAHSDSDTLSLVVQTASIRKVTSIVYFVKNNTDLVH